MKKTVKLVTVLALMLALIISCTPGPDTKPSQNGNGSDTVAPDKPSEGGSSEEGTINPNIPAAKVEDFDKIIPEAQKSQLAPTMSNEYLLVNATKDVQAKFVEKFSNSEFFKQMYEGETPSTQEYSVENNKFSMRFVYGDETKAPYFIDYFIQNGNNGNWYYESYEITDEHSAEHPDVYLVSLSGQIMYPEKYVDVKNLELGKAIESTFAYTKGSEEKYAANTLFECDRAAFDEFVTANKLEEIKNEHNTSDVKYKLEDDENSRYISAEFREKGPFTTSGMILYYTTIKPSTK